MKLLNVLMMMLVLTGLVHAYDGQEGTYQQTQDYDATGPTGSYNDDLIRRDLMDRRGVNPRLIQVMLRNNGLDLKRDTILPIVKCFMATNFYYYPALSEIQQVLRFSQRQLLDDVLFSHIKIGYCPSEQVVCTESREMEDIIVDTRNLKSAGPGITGAEIVALIAHQNLRHMVGDFDDRELTFSRYVRDIIQDQGYLQYCGDRHYRQHR